MLINAHIHSTYRNHFEPDDDAINEFVSCTLWLGIKLLDDDDDDADDDTDETDRGICIYLIN